MANLEAAAQQWTILLALTALCLTLVVLAQLFASHASAYVAAPREVIQLLDALDASIEENESYDRDVTKLSRIEDKVRLGGLLRDIQRGGDDLREAIGAQLVSGADSDGRNGNTATTLKLGARLLWAGTRRDLDDRMRRLDMLRMRFLVVYMGIVAERASTALEKHGEGSPKPNHGQNHNHNQSHNHGHGHARDPEKMPMAAPAASKIPLSPGPAPTPQMLARALTEEVKNRRPPLRRLTTHAIGHHSDTRTVHRAGWAGVVEELQRSPKLKARRMSVDRSIDAELALNNLSRLS